MLRKKAHIKIIALFVVAFICLNAGGAMCVSYCQTFDAAGEGEHCPLKKTSEHCDGQSEHQSDLASLGSHNLDCCPMTVSFFAAPIEKSSFTFDSPAPALAQLTAGFVHLSFAGRKTLDQAFNYRGPPPRDHRPDRLMHCIIRI